MPATPILPAENILTTAIAGALTPYVDAELERFKGKPRVYYRKAEQGAPLPYVIFQFQSDINRLNWINDIAATALLTLKAITSGVNYKAAHELLAAVAPAMSAITDDDYTIRATHSHTPILPEEAGSTQVALVYRITIERN